MVRVKRTSRQVPTSSSLAGAGFSVTALALTVFLEGSVAKSAPTARMHNASMDRMVFTFRRLHGESYAPLLFSGRERLPCCLAASGNQTSMYDETGSKKPPIFFPVILFCIAPSCWSPGSSPNRRLSAVRCLVMSVTQLRASPGGSGKYSGGIGKL